MHLKSLPCLLAVAWGVGLAATSAPAHAAPDDAVAYQINPAHTGSVTTGNLAPPLRKQWSVDLGGSLSYPLIAGGKIFATTGGSGGQNNAASLYALDAGTGAIVWGPISLPGTYSQVMAAYDGGKIFVVNFDGLLRSFDAATGAPGWSEQLPGQYAFSSAPTAVNGVVYVGGAGSGGTLYAVDETSGAVEWTAPVENGDDSSPVVTNDGVYVSYAGPQTYKFDLSGTLQWRYEPGIEGGGGATPAFYNGQLYVRDDINYYHDGTLKIFDGATGTLVKHTGTVSYKGFAFDSGRGFFLDNGGNLRGQDLASGNTLWTFSNGSSDVLTTPPLVVNGFVYVVTSGGQFGPGTGTLFALNPTTGAQVWSDNIGAPVGGSALTAMAAGGGLLLVPAGHVLVAYSPFVRSWSAVCDSIGSDGRTRLLWDSNDGMAAFWRLDAAGSFLDQQNYGPFPGWTARLVAAGPDNNTRVLWANADGRVTFWRQDSQNRYLDQQDFGPFPGWSVSSMSVGPDNDTHVLWTNTDGRAAIWRLDSANRFLDQQNYGPFPGWTSRSVAAGPDGNTRALWVNANGSVTFWRLDPQNRYIDQQNFGSFPGWSVSSMSVGPDSGARVLWANAASGLAVFWRMNAQNQYVDQQNYGPLLGLTAQSIASAPDGSTRALFTNVSGQMSLWSLDSDNVYTGQQNYGPY